MVALRADGSSCAKDTNPFAVKPSVIATYHSVSLGIAVSLSYNNVRTSRILYAFLSGLVGFLTELNCVRLKWHGPLRM